MAFVKKLFLLGPALLALLAVLSWTVTTDHATCAGCLAQAHGRDVSMLGFTVSKSLSIKHDYDYPDIPEDAPEIFKEIRGFECPHCFKRGGMGKSTWGMVSCGHFAEEIAFTPRIRALSSLFRTHKRLSDVKLTEAGLDLIDQELPANASVPEALAYRSLTEGPTFLEMTSKALEKAKTKEEWAKAMQKEP